MNRSRHGIDTSRGRTRIGPARGSSPLARRRPMFSARRRSPWVGRGLAFAGLAVSVLMLAAAAANESVAGATVPEDYTTSAAVAPGEIGAIRPAASPATPVFAVHGDLALHLPSPATLLIGFHEASHGEAVDLLPRGDAVSNENRTRYTAPPDVDGPAYHVMSSRGRAPGATTAVDIVLEPGEDVRSMVDGTVVDVRPYLLYGRYQDTRIEIAPTARPDLRVVVIHVTEVVVQPGDVLEAGRTVLAGSANVFGFASQVDRYLPERRPHVHLEVKPASASVLVADS